jgi:hypothetical protein
MEFDPDIQGFWGSFSAGGLGKGMERISKPQVSIGIYTCKEILSTADFIKKLTLPARLDLS